MSASDVTVLICGESGVGKEVASRTLHDCSRRHSGPSFRLHSSRGNIRELVKRIAVLGVEAITDELHELEQSLPSTLTRPTRPEHAM